MMGNDWERNLTRTRNVHQRLLWWLWLLVCCCCGCAGYSLAPWTRWYAPPFSSSSSLSSSSDNNDNNNNRTKTAPFGLRLNKVFRNTHSRRQSDALIAAGRVWVNGQVVHDAGRRVVLGDVVAWDNGTVVATGWQAEWQATATAATATATATATDLVTIVPIYRDDNDNHDNNNHDNDAIHNRMKHEYIKYWKPVGITCTTDRRIPGNLLDELLRNDRITTPPQVAKRIFPVGRLDKDTSGLILLTSDGRLPNAVLRGAAKQPKTYHVTTDRYVSQRHVQQLRDGVVITTQSGQYGTTSRKTRTARTLPAQVQRLSLLDNRHNQPVLIMTLVEGRNRQIRKMLAAVGYEVTALHRVAFLGLTLQGLPGPGHWQRVPTHERLLLERALQEAAASVESTTHTTTTTTTQDIL